MKTKLIIGIRYRLFFAFLAAACCVVVSMFIVTRVSFERGVFRYVNLVAKERLETLARTLEQVYGEKKQWTFLEEPSTSWSELVESSIPRHPHHRKNQDQPEEMHSEHGSSRQRDRPPPPPPLPSGEQIFELRVLLLDAQRQILYGPGKPWVKSPFFLPLTVDRQIIGYLGLIPPRTLIDERVRQFAREQNQSLIVIALSIAAGAALLSIPLASKLVRRITTLAAATTQLASGCYDIRVAAETTDELGQLARDFNRLAETLEKNEQLRRRWVADISHELRTPLSVLRGEVEAVQDGVRQLTPQTMDSLHSEILHLSRLVDDLYELSLADIGALTYHKENLDLRTLVGQAVQSYKDEFSTQSLTLEYAAPARPLILFGDPERLRQLMNNLLQNALRYTDPGGKLQIGLTERAEDLQLRFADSAPGVPEEALAHLFERLYRVENSRNRAHGGAGLGLALCKTIVEAHGGAINAAPSSLGGLEITITLPKNG
jgi:two-component system sensor histidine kinase BaeS